MKISIVGSGRVGAAVGFAVLNIVKPEELVLQDIVPGVAEGEALDLAGAAVQVSPSTVISGSDKLEIIESSDFIVVTAGLARSSTMTREQLFEKNKSIIEGIAKVVPDISPKAYVFVATNPSSKIAEVFRKASGFPKERVFVLGTETDTARLRYLLGKELKKNPDKIKSFVFGEHGEKMQFEFKEEPKDRTAMEDAVRGFGAKVIGLKGYTAWGVAVEAALAIKKFAKK
ncbi:MAG: hypothetical protein HY362_01600 [Candidatus Aenigmarchaeota archaeon]|nr:hypothetical protein [Candidatus Aenigmarchaeota archaeon]